MNCSDINIGDLNERVTIETYTITKHPDTNEEVTQWTQTATVWAKVEAANRLRDDEKAILTRESAIMAYIVTVRYNADLLDRKNRITIDGTAYDIEGTVKIGRKSYLKLYVTYIE